MRTRRHNNCRLAAVLIALGLLAGACSSPSAEPTPATEPVETSRPTPSVETAPVPVRAYTDGDRVIIERGPDRWDFLAGVNLGVTIPGHYPGELAVSAETYRRWFPMMTDLGIHIIRVYTIQRPHFYEELRAYNLDHPDEPLFLVHGVWIDEEQLLATQDLYDKQLSNDFRTELTSAVGAVAGAVTLSERPGRASGQFTADVTPWLVGWILGIELDPNVVAATDVSNRGRSVHAGAFFSAGADATPTESWYAAQLDHLATELTARDLSMPVAFTNWPTTDPLDHPYEPLVNEDLVGIDPNHVYPESPWIGGYFASYHAYPYYPDFQQFEPALLDYEFQGQLDPYAGYLAMLREHHSGIPVVVAEFGVPGGMGLAHRGPLGRDQGAHSEPDQMALNAEMLEIIRAQGLAGGLLFEWADEWFKRTWNTVDYEQPADRRALWDNAFNNEAHFGLLAIEPGLDMGIMLDGSLDDWDSAGSASLFTGDGVVQEVMATHDAAYLYLMLRLEPGSGQAITVGFDVVNGDSGGLPGTGGLDPAADYAWTLGHGTDGRGLVRASNDLFGVRYGLNAEYMPFEAADFIAGSGAWNVLNLLASYPLTVPPTGVSIPAESFAVGELVHGSTDPKDPAFDSRAAWFRNETVVELRVPYAAIGVSDPSSRQALRVDGDGTTSTEQFDSVGISVAVAGEFHQTAGYRWERWDAVDWHERLKAGVELIRTAMAEPSNS